MTSIFARRKSKTQVVLSSRGGRGLEQQRPARWRDTINHIALAESGLHCLSNMVGGSSTSLALQVRRSLAAGTSRSRIVSSITQSAEHPRRAAFQLVETCTSSHIRRPLFHRRCISTSLRSQETADGGTPNKRGRYVLSPTREANRVACAEGEDGEDGHEMDYPLEKDTGKISMDELLELASCNPTALSLEAM